MSQTTFNEDIYAPNISCKSIKATGPCISNAMIEAAAAISATKLEHRYNAKYAQKAGTDVVSETMPVHTCRAAAVVTAIEVVPIVAPTGGDKQFTVNVRKGNAGGAFATILSAVVTIDQSDASRTVYTATINAPNLAAGDTLDVVITASGATGSQGQGVLVNVHVEEQAA